MGFCVFSTIVSDDIYRHNILMTDPSDGLSFPLLSRFLCRITPLKDDFTRRNFHSFRYGNTHSQKPPSFCCHNDFSLGSHIVPLWRIFFDFPGFRSESRRCAIYPDCITACDSIPTQNGESGWISVDDWGYRKKFSRIIHTYPQSIQFYPQGDFPTAVPEKALFHTFNTPYYYY